MYILMNRVNEAEAEGRDLLKKLAEAIDLQIQQAKIELAERTRPHSNV